MPSAKNLVISFVTLSVLAVTALADTGHGFEQPGKPLRQKSSARSASHVLDVYDGVSNRVTVGNIDVRITRRRYTVASHGSIDTYVKHATSQTRKLT
jgi:hypothetical protein